MSLDCCDGGVDWDYTLMCWDFCLIKCEIESDSIGNDTNKYKIYLIDLKFEINSISNISFLNFNIVLFVFLKLQETAFR